LISCAESGIAGKLAGLLAAGGLSPAGLEAQQ